MGDLWDDDGFGSGGAEPEANGDDDWDEGEESLDTSLEEGFDDPDEPNDDDGRDEDEAGENGL